MPVPTPKSATDVSFLAQLRKQHQPQNALQLCYLLQPGSDAIKLSLRLGNFAQGQLRDVEQKYCLQLAHLNSPPAFLTETDVSLLRQMIHWDATWAGRESGLIPPGQQLQHLPVLVATGRCFDSQLKPLRWGESFISAPYWQLTDDGRQTLVWSTPTACDVWQNTPLPLICQAGILRSGDSHHSEEQHQAIAQAPTLSATAVDIFLKDAGSLWRDLNLPLPEEIKPLPRVGIFTVQLLCQSNYSNVNTQPRDLLQLRFVYQTELITWLQMPPFENTAWISRTAEEFISVSANSALEQFWLARLSEYLSQKMPGAFEALQSGLWHATKTLCWRDLLIQQRDALETMGVTLICAEGFRFPYARIAQWNLDIRTQGDLFQLHAQAIADGKEINIEELLAQLRALNLRASDDEIEIRLKDVLVLLPRTLACSLRDELAEWDFSGTGFPRSQVYRLNNLGANLPENTHWQGNTQLLEQAVQLHKSPELLDLELTGLKAQLRPYQWLGVCWLQHLKKANFNGLLADDMGLGKTLQTIAHLCLEKQQGHLTQPVLIIAPTSLLPNWTNEIKRFAPHLAIATVQGQQRHTQRKTADIFITSYALAVRDCDFWSSQNLSWLILDEAQAIKNPSTQTSRALRQFSAHHKVCLSGTPVENHLGELWSLMDFLQPGYLGSQIEFKQYYQKPIEQDGNTERLQQLQNCIAPLMMRRTKSQVAQDLPPKTEIERIIPLSSEQYTFYQHLQQNSWEALQAELNGTEHQGEQHMLVLAALLRLRQACCDPKLLGEHTIPSAKTDACIEMLQSLAGEGRYTLVFSQFTRMLDILAEQLTVLGIEYRLLTGKSTQREKLVEDFQAGLAPVFLISLKAGGVGLNLTKADTVIHFDPWWNAAARDQASDRAHRIGQTQPVFVYNLITENTIEEKIAQLQSAKDLLGQQINQSAQDTGARFALKLEDLLSLWQEGGANP